jgi:hypothetical protein
MTIVNAGNNQPLNNVQVRIKRTNGSYANGWTDSLGNLCGKVPKDEALILQVIDQCNVVAYSQNIGPFSADANLGTISVTLPATNTLTITGTLTNCANVNVTNGAVVINSSGSFSYVIPVSNGTFSLTIVRCSGGTLNFSVLGIDYAALQQSILYTGSGTIGIVNVGTIQACGTSSAQYAQYIIDGAQYNFAAPPDQFSCGDSTGVWPGGYTNKTSFSGYQGSGNTVVGAFSLSFVNNQISGTYPILQGHIQYTASVQATQFVSTTPMVNITAFGTTGGGFIEGNFTEMMIVSGTPKMVSCTFRIRRL